jgi:hypothetical protein
MWPQIMKSISIQQKQNNNNWPRDLQKITNNLNRSWQSVIQMSPDDAYRGSWDNDADVIAKIRKSFDGKWQEVRTFIYIYLKKVTTHLNIWFFYF